MKHKHLVSSDNIFPSLFHFRKDVDHLFDNFFSGVNLTNGGEFSPKCNISETDKSYHIEVQTPGFSEDEIDLSLENNVLTINGEHKYESKHEDKNYHLIEFSHAKIQRSWELPSNVDIDQLGTAFNNGILTIDIPKKDSHNSKKKIALNKSN